MRPSLFAFGTLADGYVPFVMPDGSEQTIGLASVVMKVRREAYTLIPGTYSPPSRLRTVCALRVVPCCSAAALVCAASA